LEAIVLAGGKAERLGDAAQGRPKALVEVAGRPLLAYQIGILKRAGVRRVVVSCAAGEGDRFSAALDGLGVEIVPAAEPERLGRGGGLRFASSFLDEPPPVYGLNGDELLDIDLRQLLALHSGHDAAATITVAPLLSQFGIVEIEGDLVRGFTEAPRLPHWVNTGVYVLGAEALERMPEKGDHETTLFPELAAEGKLRAFHHEGLWLTVNTPKDLRRAEDHVGANPQWLSAE
jgi:NDP-sugar pyrophosphorylase family protein